MTDPATQPTAARRPADSAAAAAAADEIFAALRSGHDDLAPLVGSLSPEQLRGPSGASEWDVYQVLSHLGSGAVITLAGLEAALRGEPDPGLEANQKVWARWDAMFPRSGPPGSSPRTPNCWPATTGWTPARARTCASTWASCRSRWTSRPPHGSG